jgi:hypothetical protein
MAMMNTSNNPGGGTTVATGAPDFSAPPVIDPSSLTGALMQKIALSRAMTQAKMNALNNQGQSQGGGGGQRTPVVGNPADETQPFYYKMMGGPGATPGYTEVPAGTPGAVYGGMRPKSQAPQAGGHIQDSNQNGASLSGPGNEGMQDYVNRMTAQAQQVGDGKGSTQTDPNTGMPLVNF